VTIKLVGASGLAVGVLLIEFESIDDPILLVALTVKVYLVPRVKPVMVLVRVPAAKFTTAEITVPVSGVATNVKLVIESPFSTVPENRIVA
jgi:hypothetical protein